MGSWQRVDTDNGRKAIGNNLVELATWNFDLLSGSSWTSYELTRSLLIDFDDGTAVHDAFGMFEEKPQTGVANERNIAPGDSGGPWFQTIDGQQYIIGVTSQRMTAAELVSAAGPLRVWGVHGIMAIRLAKGPTVIASRRSYG